jgi:hypothetical protein
MRAGERVEVVRRRVVGAVFISVIVLFLASTVAVYQKAFTPVVDVLLRTDRVGNQLQPPSDVKVRGLVVGEVREVRATASGAELDLALHPDKARPGSPRGCCPRPSSASATSASSRRPSPPASRCTTTTSSSRTAARRRSSWRRCSAT